MEIYSPEVHQTDQPEGNKLIFVTKISTKLRSQYGENFISLGISVTEDEMFSSSFVAAVYLKVNNFLKEKKVFVSYPLSITSHVGRSTGVLVTVLFDCQDNCKGDGYYLFFAC